MPDAARQYPSHEAANRPATAPLRDWLAQIRAQAAAVQQEHPAEPEHREPERQGPERQEPERAERPSWAPRLVPPAAPVFDEPASAAETDQDISELMAQNMLLKAQLRLEGDRYDELQSMLAEEIRALRRHVEAEMTALADIRDERDLWQARAEALAQPLFQRR